MQVPAGKPGPLDRAEEARRAVLRGAPEASRLAPFLRDPDPLVRGTVAGMLFLRRESVPDGLLRELAEACGDPEELRLVRAEVAASGRGADATVACRLAAGEAGAAIRSRAVRGCVRAGASSAAELARFARDASWQVRTRLAVALRERREREGLSPEGREVLEALAADPHPTVATAAAGNGTGKGT